MAGKVVQVAAHRGWREAEQVSELGGTDGAMLQHGVQHAVPGTLIGVGRMHRRDGRGGRLRRACGTVPGKGSRRRGAHGIHNTIMS
jgi:hypothetical protein